MISKQETKKCPYCAELIKAEAIKCRYCGSDLTKSPTSGLLTTGALVAGHLKDKYAIIGEVGKGGMASVYKAKQLSLDRIVALKVVHQNLIHDEEFLKRFHREAKLAASLNHPNIVTIHDVGQQGPVHYMAMEFLEGEDLHQRIKREGYLKKAEIVRIGTSLSQALDYAHMKGIIHRDIKSSNIFLTKDGRILLTDFGIAKAASDSGLTQAGEVMGTPEFMSPEQAAGKEIDARSDLYSLGVVIYECLTGKVPFYDKNKLALVHNVIYEQLTSPRDLKSDIPEWLNSIILKLLEKKSENRFKTGKELIQALKEKRIVKIIIKPEEHKTKKLITDKQTPDEQKREPTNTPQARPKQKSLYTSRIQSKPNPPKRKGLIAVLVGAIIIAVIVIIQLVNNSGEDQYIDSDKITPTDSVQTEETAAVTSEYQLTVSGRETSTQNKEAELLKETLSKAQNCLSQNRLTTPDEYNAWYYVQEVLKTDPDNEEALSLKMQIALKYESLGDGSLIKKRFGEAEQYYQKGNEIDQSAFDLQALLNKVAETRRTEQANIDAKQLLAEKQRKENEEKQRLENERMQTEISKIGTLTDSRDGNTYDYKTIGTQAWMIENLAYLPSVSPSNVGSSGDPYYYVYDYEGISISSAKATNNYETYGVLYNWEAANTACPTGWHLPSDEEWTILTDYLTNNSYGYGGSENDIGKSMASTMFWKSSSEPGKIGNNQPTNNSCGFDALPGGERNSNGDFNGLGYTAHFWSMSPNGSSSAWIRFLSSHDDGFYQGYSYSRDGFSVRCLKN